MLYRILLVLEVKGVDEVLIYLVQSVVYGLYGNDYLKFVFEFNCERCKVFFNKYVIILENVY